MWFLRSEKITGLLFFIFSGIVISVAFQNCSGSFEAQRDELTQEEIQVFQELMSEGWLEESDIVKARPSSSRSSRVVRPRIECPANTSHCTTENGESETCCGAGTHCFTYKTSAYCAPNDENTCKSPKFYCGPKGGTVKGDSACCNSGAQCKSIVGIYYCDEQKDCEQRGGKKCGSSKCCTSGQTCSGDSKASGCYQTLCGEGEHACQGKLPNGDDWQICCASGTQCVPGVDGGAPNCAPNPAVSPRPSPTSTSTPVPGSL